MTESPDLGFSGSLKRKRRVPLRPFVETLAECRKEITESSMLQELSQVLAPYLAKIKKIRCLAIGSFHTDQPALYQLALLFEICELVAGGGQKDPVLVSLYDPAFTEEDKEFIAEQRDSWSIDEQSPWGVPEASSILFFLPHAPLDLTEHVISTEQPRLWLANHLVRHTDRYTKAQLFKTYPLMSKLLNSLTGTREKEPSSEVPQSDFAPFISRRNRRKNKNKYQEPKIDYDSIISYFSKCAVLSDFDNGNLLKDKEWLNSFSDLCLHLIQ